MSDYCTTEQIDAEIVKLEKSVVRHTLSASSAVRGRAAERDLLSNTEKLRGLLSQAVKGEKYVLDRTFGGSCERIGRLLICLEGVRFSDMHAKDTRWNDLRSAVEIIEGVLKDMGTFKRWEPQVYETTTPYKRSFSTPRVMHHYDCGDEEVADTEALAFEVEILEASAKTDAVALEAQCFTIEAAAPVFEVGTGFVIPAHADTAAAAKHESSLETSFAESDKETACSQGDADTLEMNSPVVAWEQELTSDVEGDDFVPPAAAQPQLQLQIDDRTVETVDVVHHYVEKLVEVPEVRVIDKVSYVPKIEIVEVIKEVPKIEIQTVEKIVEVPEIREVEKLKGEVDIVRYIPKIETVEKIVEVKKIEIQTVEKIVEVPEVRLVERIVEVPEVHVHEVVRYVNKWVDEDGTAVEEPSMQRANTVHMARAPIKVEQPLQRPATVLRGGNMHRARTLPSSALVNAMIPEGQPVKLATVLRRSSAGANSGIEQRLRADTIDSI